MRTCCCHQPGSFWCWGAEAPCRLSPTGRDAALSGEGCSHRRGGSGCVPVEQSPPPLHELVATPARSSRPNWMACDVEVDQAWDLACCWLAHGGEVAAWACPTSLDPHRQWCCRAGAWAGGWPRVACTSVARACGCSTLLPSLRSRSKAMCAAHRARRASVTGEKNCPSILNGVVFACGCNAVQTTRGTMQ